MVLDLSMLIECKKPVCVRCRDEESTLDFLKEMFAQYPEQCSNWTPEENKWDINDGNPVTYFPYLNKVLGNRLLWDGSDYAERNGYKIIEYYDLARTQSDLGEIDAQGVDISMLFQTDV